MGERIDQYISKLHRRKHVENPPELRVMVRVDVVYEPRASPILSNVAGNPQHGCGRMDIVKR